MEKSCCLLEILNNMYCTCVLNLHLQSCIILCGFVTAKEPCQMNDLLYKKNIVKQTLYKNIQQQVDIDINVKREKQSTSH